MSRINVFKMKMLSVSNSSLRAMVMIIMYGFDISCLSFLLLIISNHHRSFLHWSSSDTFLDYPSSSIFCEWSNHTNLFSANTSFTALNPNTFLTSIFYVSIIVSFNILRKNFISNALYPFCCLFVCTQL